MARSAKRAIVASFGGKELTVEVEHVALLRGVDLAEEKLESLARARPR